MNKKLTLRRGLRPPAQPTLPGIQPLPPANESMRLWHIFARGDLPKDDDPWEPWYDTAEGFVVRAPNEKDARAYASERGGDELRRQADAWTNPRYSHCEVLPIDGQEGVILRDFNAA